MYVTLPWLLGKASEGSVSLSLLALVMLISRNSIQPLKFLALFYIYRLNFNDVILVNEIGKVTCLKKYKMRWFWIKCLTHCITSTCSCSGDLKSSIQIKNPGVFWKRYLLMTVQLSDNVSDLRWCKRTQSSVTQACTVIQ